MTETQRRRRGRVVGGIAVLTVLGFAAAACGDDSKSTTSTTAGGSSTSAAGGSTSAGLTTLPSTTAKAADNSPKRGGTLTYGLEAETATGYSALYSQFAISGETIARAIYDPVMAIGEDGKAHGMLAESFKPNADYTQWVVKMRSGIKFHDGTDLDGTALKMYIEDGRCSALVATAFGEFGGCPKTYDPSKPEDPKTNRKPLSTIFKAITVDPNDKMTVTIDLLAPYAVLDYSAQGWYLQSPKNVDDAVNSPKNPIGTGPFKFKSWTVNDNLQVVKNPDYWLKAPDGQPYPYLDGITFRPIDDIAARENCLRGGQCDLIMTSNGDSINKFRAEKNDWNIFENAVGAETGHYMLNNNPTYNGKENPLADVNVRTGLAKCIDYDELNKLRNGNVAPVPNGPYPPGSDGYIDDTGYPKTDFAGGKKLLDDYKAAKGITGDLTLELGTTADPFNRGTNELIASYWKKCGVNGQIDQTEQGQYITRALVGDFQVFAWRNFGGLNPDRNFVWWLSAFAIDPPGIALNFGRIKDKQIDADLTTIRTSGDPDKRKAAAQDINKVFAKQVYNIWTQWTVWQMVANKKVQDVGASFKAPDGTKLVNTHRVSMHALQQIWIK
jgi:peptide/nickel transport system substrate-binding protein